MTRLLLAAWPLFAGALATAFLPPAAASFRNLNLRVPGAEEACLNSSLSLTNLTITDAAIIMGNPMEHQNTSVTFNAYNTAAGVDAKCSASNVALTPQATGSDPYQWYDCAITSSKSPNATLKFRYDGTLQHLTVNETWVCQDEAADTPLLFTAFSFNQLPIDCKQGDGTTFSTRQCIQDKDSKIYFPVEVTARSLEPVP
ncbi:hypothetical protein B0H63DRAFT_523447 [Podospora didyma]|uniref:AA1-like domain-containing protein n=1 Tax=Podospora didyma TaxID=330526 RepID=A0AAE0NRD4_9PEZI|nr:hypothetical protein B0H63DRAFT_523447 [Podospora didyma]